MVILKIVATTLGDNVEVVMTARPYLARADESAVKRIVGVVHLVHTEDYFQAVLIESFVMGLQAEVLLSSVQSASKHRGILAPLQYPHGRDR